MPEINVSDFFATEECITDTFSDAVCAYVEHGNEKTVCASGNVETTVNWSYHSETITTTIDANQTERNGLQK